ncbi:MAG TPA: carboxy terminal-processing peptidase [Pontiellaceae bacterium]|nr:carboxy terminal-processing peptidase [Pontiellaceae bacterium]
MRKHPLYLLLLAAVLAGCGKPEVPANAANALAQDPIPSERIAARIADRLPHIHLNRNAFDDSIATNALALYIDSLDYDHTFFLASDIAEFQKQATNLDNQVVAGDTSYAQVIFDRFKERVTNRVAYVNQLLNQPMDLDQAEKYRWKRDTAPWPENETEWNDLWRKKVKNDYVSRIAAIEAGKNDPKPEGTNTVDEARIEALTPVEFVRERYKQYQLLIDNNFDKETVLQRYLSAFTRSYDPHSEYLSPRGVEDFDINMSLSLVGIGAMLRTEDGMAKITQLIAGGPAELDGRLRAGDKIIAVAQSNAAPVSILYWPLSKAVRLIRGEKGTKVVLTIIPADDTTGTRTKTIDLIRDEVKLEAQAAKGEVRQITETNGVPHRIGVLTLPEFYADFAAARNGKDGARRASVDVRRILGEFAAKRVDGVILDLRNDGGGSLAEAIDIAGLFISAGPVVQVREQRGVAVLPDGDPDTVYSGPLVVLVNRLSASASEIVAAALQDYGRALIVGDSKTHGKGTVQTVFPLSKLSDDLGSIKVTTASFYRIAGGSTQLKGVVPDVVLPSLYDALDIGEESLPKALPWSQVRSAYYRMWPDSVKPAIPELRKHSEMRMAGNPAFTTFLARRDRLRSRMANPEISLKLSDRVGEIVAEKELEKLQDEELGGSKKADKEDPILDETVNILADMVDLAGEKSGSVVTQNRN